MHDPLFRRASRPLPLAAVAALGPAPVPPEADATMIVTAVATLATARPGELAMADDGAAPEDLRTTRAGACFVAPQRRDEVPPGTVALVTDDPVQAFAAAAALIDPGSRPGLRHEGDGVHPRAVIDAQAVLEPGVSVGPGTVVGPGAEVGGGTRIGANCVIDADVRIGRDCAIGPLATVSHALIGDVVVVHAGARIGVGETKGPWLGRAIVQNGVEIGANAIVARGARHDTVIGEGAVVEAAAIVASDTVVARNAMVRGNAAERPASTFRRGSK